MKWVIWTQCHMINCYNCLWHKLLKRRFCKCDDLIPKWDFYSFSHYVLLKTNLTRQMVHVPNLLDLFHLSICERAHKKYVETKGPISIKWYGDCTNILSSTFFQNATVRFLPPAEPSCNSPRRPVSSRSDPYRPVASYNLWCVAKTSQEWSRKAFVLLLMWKSHPVPVKLLLLQHLC